MSVVINQDPRSGSLTINDYNMKEFFKFYFMGSTEINLYGKAHEKIDFILLLKMNVIPRVGRFV